MAEYKNLCSHSINNLQSHEILSKFVDLLNSFQIHTEMHQVNQVISICNLICECLKEISRNFEIDDIIQNVKPQKYIKEILCYVLDKDICNDEKQNDLSIILFMTLNLAQFSVLFNEIDFFTFMNYLAIK